MRIIRRQLLMQLRYCGVPMTDTPPYPFGSIVDVIVSGESINR